MKMEQTKCSKTLAYKIQMPGNYPEKKHTTFRTWRKFEIDNDLFCFTYLLNMGTLTNEL